MTKEKTKDRGYNMDLHEYYRNKGCSLYLLLVLFISIPLLGDEIKFKFKSPFFSGEGTSAHYLTIENHEFNRKEALEDEIQALKDELERDAENTTLARFLRNFESRVYAQLSRQLVDPLA